MQIDSALYEIIKKVALKNAYRHNGRTNVNIVLSHLISTNPELRKSVDTIVNIVRNVVDEVNMLSRNNQELLMQQLVEHNKSQKIVESKDYSLPDLPFAKRGKVVTRFPPEPNGYPHIGHAKAAIIDEEYAKMYDGKMILRFDDTNPTNEKMEYYEAIRDGMDWLEIKLGLVKNTSDDINKLLDYGKQLVDTGHAYVCTCSPEIIRKNRTEQIECVCRHDLEVAFERFDKILNGYYLQNEAVVRFKGDMRSLNTVMRDPTLFRIIDHPHPKLGSKIHLWPTYDMAAPIEDSLDGVTHALRTKEYELRNELYYAILRNLKLRSPLVIEFSRLEFEGMPVSKRKIKPLLEQGLIPSWDDPRLPTLSALQKRGFTPAAIRKFVLGLGLTLAETKPPFEALESINRKIIDPISKRLFFVPSAVQLKVKGSKHFIVELRNHPTLDLGKRLVEVANDFYIASTDADDLKVGQVIRLMELYNIEILEVNQEKSNRVIIADYKDDQIIQSMKKIQWVAKNDAIEFAVTIPKDLFIRDVYNPDSLIIVRGCAESYVSKLNTGTAIQFVRFGFCKLGSPGFATYTHR
ncbi:MAG TPA: glutamate--tRNA ligase [Nitrososphaeraceae archaeon]